MCSETVAETMDGETVAWLRAQAAQRGVTITGSIAIEDGQRFNRMLWMSPDGGNPDGGVPNGGNAVYDKRHLFRYGGEHHHYTGGKDRGVMELGGWRMWPSRSSSRAAGISPNISVEAGSSPMWPPITSR